MKKLRLFLTALIVSASSALSAQDADSLLLGDELDFLLSDDSLSIFRLIDSLLNTDMLKPTSQFSARMGYNSNVMAAGRTLGIQNFGLSPGLAYYHKSGFYGDITGFWSKDFEPSYYLTITSLGYSHLFTKCFSLLASYDRYFYNTSEEAYIPYKNSLTLTPLIDYKYLNAGLSYSFYFGDKQVHRITPSIGVNLERKKVGPFKRIAFLPSFLLLLGNESFTHSEVLIPQTRRQALDNLRTYGKLFPVIETTTHEFGIMNYSVSAPLSITYKKINLVITYVYSIPRALPSETLTFSESSFLSANLNYFFKIK